MDFFLSNLPQTGIFGPKWKRKNNHRIQHIGISLDRKFHLKHAILSLRTKVALKEYGPKQKKWRSLRIQHIRISLDVKSHLKQKILIFWPNLFILFSISFSSSFMMEKKEKVWQYNKRGIALDNDNAQSRDEEESKLNSIIIRKNGIHTSTENKII